MRVVQIAPPWFPVPPTGYGGIERVVYDLTEGLLAAGCEVTLCAPVGSQTNARFVPTVPRPVGLNLTEAQKNRHFVDASRVVHAQALFDRDRIARQYLALYERVLAERTE